MRAWIGLGGNQGDSAMLLDRSLSLLPTIPGIEVLRASRQYHSPPWGPVEQPDFVNAVAELWTELEPLALLQQLLGLERRLGRDRSEVRWGPRCIDLDLLTYEDLTMQSAELTLPHPNMHQRAFVLVPLLELEPRFVIPGVGAAAEFLRSIDPQERAAVLPVAST